MTDAPLTNGGSKLPILPMLLLLATASIGALTTWLFKVDDRLFSLSRDVPTRSEIQILRAELNSRLDRIDSTLATALARPQPIPHP